MWEKRQIIGFRCCRIRICYQKRSILITWSDIDRQLSILAILQKMREKRQIIGFRCRWIWFCIQNRSIAITWSDIDRRLSIFGDFAKNAAKTPNYRFLMLLNPNLLSELIDRNHVTYRVLVFCNFAKFAVAATAISASACEQASQSADWTSIFFNHN